MLEPDEILELVHTGAISISITIIDRHIAKFWAQIFPGLLLHEELVIASERDIAWAFRKNNPKLEKILNDFLVPRRHRTALQSVRNPERLKPEQASSLANLFEANESLFQAYLLKDALRNLWTYIYPKWADKYLSKWISWVNDSEIQPLIKFAKGLDRDRMEILACIKHRITSAKLEAFNGTINRIVKRACGYGL